MDQAKVAMLRAAEQWSGGKQMFSISYITAADEEAAAGRLNIAMAYQEVQRLPPAGEPDEATREALCLDAPEAA